MHWINSTNPHIHVDRMCRLWLYFWEEKERELVVVIVKDIKRYKEGYKDKI